MNRVAVVVLWLIALALCGCSKALTESSAVGVVQKYVDAQNDGTIFTFAGALTNQLGVEMPQRWDVPGVQRVLKEGYLQEKTAAITYPNFSGEFSGNNNTPWPWADTLRVQTSTDRPPRVSGMFKHCAFDSVAAGPYNSCDWANVNGIAQKIGAGQSQLSLNVIAHDGFLTLEQTKAANPPSLTPEPQQNSPFQIALLRGNPDTITIDFGRGPIPLQGHTAGPDIQQQVYMYTWTDKLPKDTVTGSNLILGHLIVESCDHLLLTSETAATASCKTHVKLTSAAAVIFGNRPTDQSMQVSFGKQPDGTWIGTQLSYNPPQYMINQ